MKRSSFIVILTLLGSVIFTVDTARAQWPILQRNVSLNKLTPILMDASYAENYEIHGLYPQLAHPQPDHWADIRACKSGTPDIHQCTKALLVSVDSGISIDELVPYLEKLHAYPSDRLVIVSYAGELWYRIGARAEALLVWSDWLAPLQRIDKAVRLYDAGHVYSALTLISSLDLETRIEAGIQRSSLTRILVHAAQESSRNQDYKVAEMYWRGAAVQYPERAAYDFNLAEALRSQGRFGDALSPLQEAIRLRPDSVSYHLRLAQTLEKLGRLAEAKESAQRVLELDPNNQNAQNLLDRLGQ